MRERLSGEDIIEHLVVEVFCAVVFNDGVADIFEILDRIEQAYFEQQHKRQTGGGTEQCIKPPAIGEEPVLLRLSYFEFFCFWNCAKIASEYIYGLSVGPHEQVEAMGL